MNEKNIHLESLRHRIRRYVANKMVGEFLGFVTGLWAAGLVSLFFEKKSFQNLWGLLAKKPVVGDRVFSSLQWILSAVIGFAVLELVNELINMKRGDAEYDHENGI